MKKIAKTLTASALAASLLVGGGLMLQQHAFAEDAGAAVSADTQTPAPAAKSEANGRQGRGGFGGHERRGGGPGLGGGKGFTDMAAVLGLEQSAVMEELKQGKTLAEIAQEKAGLSEEALLQKLTDAETKRIDEALAAGQLTQEQADRQKAGLADRLKQMVERKGGEGGGKSGGHGHPGGQHGKGGLGFWGGPEELSGLLGWTAEELRTQTEAGKSLSDIAQEKGISEDQLIQKLKDGMTDKLKSFVQEKRTPRAKAAQPTAAANSNS